MRSKARWYAAWCMGLLFMTGLVACKSGGMKAAQGNGEETSGKRAVYYWKTILRMSDEDLKFIKSHGIGKMYVRFFDVIEGTDFDGKRKALPEATLQFEETIPKDIEIVPVVFITVESLREGGKDLAVPLYTRVKAMCEANGIENLREIQLDCDWTVSTREIFYKVCAEVREMAHRDGIDVSATIRLHQLKSEAPPVDRGVLMLYNTGNIYDEKEENSILSYENAEPYLRQSIKFDLPLSLALPTYQWGLLYRDGEFMCILHNEDFDDEDTFESMGNNRMRVIESSYTGDMWMLGGDEVRIEWPDMETIRRVKKLAMKQIKDPIEETIIYHLDATNLAKYTFDEMEEILGE